MAKEEGMKIKPLFLEILIILVFAACFLYFGIGNILNHQIVHSHPYNILASDAAGEITYVESVKEMGNFNHMHKAVCGGKEDCIIFMPPMSQILGAAFSSATGLESYDVNIFFAGIFMLITCLVIYLGIRRWNKQVAMLSLPVMLFLFQPQFSIGIMWGYYDVIEGSVFIAAIILLLSIIEKENKDNEEENGKKENNKNNESIFGSGVSWVIFAILLAAGFIIHVSEMIYAGIIIGIYFVIKSITDKKINKQTIMDGLKIGGVTLLLIANFALTLGVGHSSQPLFSAPSVPQWYDPILSNFNWIMYLIIAGAAISCIVLFKDFKPALVAGGVMLFLGYNVMNLSFIRTFQIRYTWPIYLAVFFGFAIYFVLKLTNLNKMMMSSAISLILIILILSLYPRQMSSEGMLSQNHWDALKWMKENTPKDTKILFMYGDIYNQEAVMWSTMRLTYKIKDDEFVNKIKNGELSKNFVTYLSAPTDSDFAYWIGFNNVGYYYRENSEEFKIKERNICTFEYLVFDRVSRQSVLAQYNLLIAQKMIEGKSFTPAYYNDYVVILKKISNNDNCFEDGKLQAN